MSILKKLVEKLLAWSARRQLAVARPFVIGVTGSSGKTSTKEAIGHVLRLTVKDRQICVAAGNLNTEFGLPLAILQLPKPEEKIAWVGTTFLALLKGLMPTRPRRPVVYVLEYGLQQTGDMKTLLNIVVPDMGVITSVGSVHFGDPAVTVKEKGQLVRALAPTGIAVLNGNDKFVADLSQVTKAEVVKVKELARDLARALAIEVAVHGFGVARPVAQKALQSWSPPTGRLNLLAGIKGSWLLDDTYNANPQSTALALEELKRLGRERQATRLVAVLGDMLELGPAENKAHQVIVQLAAATTHHLILVGPRFRRSKQTHTWFPGPLSAANYLKELVAKGDMILVKGSESMRMEKVSEALIDPRLEPAKVLVRQTPFWKGKPYVAP